MADFINRFLELSDYPILTNKGTISAEQARLKIEAEYKKFRVEQDKNYISDFDQEVKELVKGKSKTGGKINKNYYDSHLYSRF